MKFTTTTLLTLAAISHQSSAFAPSQIHLRSFKDASSIQHRSQSTIIYSKAEENNDEPPKETTPTPKTDAFSQQSESFTKEPVAPKRLDPLIQALTKTDEGAADVPTRKLPLLGEVPVDGSLLVLAPVALIAVVGFIMSIQIGFQSKDLIASQLDELNTVMSTPPAKQTVVYDGCRGLCSDQGDQLNSMKGFMEGLSKKKASMIEVPKPVVESVVEKVAAAPEPVAAPVVTEPIAVVPAAAAEPVTEPVVVVKNDVIPAAAEPVTEPVFVVKNDVVPASIEPVTETVVVVKNDVIPAASEPVVNTVAVTESEAVSSTYVS
jgi:hypothetical protein